jgi:hypothetical protein
VYRELQDKIVLITIFCNDNVGHYKYNKRGDTFLYKGHKIQIKREKKKDERFK